MCGIAGDIRYAKQPASDAVERMLASMGHRGPDHRGAWKDQRASLGHLRLAILDLDARANQPMHEESGRFIMTYNGEIYNFQELRERLRQEGVEFQTSGDTEVLLKAYRQYGRDCLQYLNGMFALAIWDRRDRVLFAARDRMGEKPFYYAEMPCGGIVFASEIKAFMQHPEVGDTLDLKSLGSYFANNFVAGQATLLAAVKRLPAGHYLETGAGSPVTTKPYWNLADHFRCRFNEGSIDDAKDRLSNLLDDATDIRMVSDVPVGAFLSGGVDSSAVVASMCRYREKDSVKTYCVGFDEKGYSEVNESALMANHLGVTHSYETVRSNVADDLVKIVGASDEPLADTSIIPMYYLARLARKDVTVCLSGDGADELFAGYDTYLADALCQRLQFLPRSAIGLSARIANSVMPVTRNKVGMDYKVRQFFKGAVMNRTEAHWHWRNIFDRSTIKTVISDDLPQEVADNNGFEVVKALYDEVRDLDPMSQNLYVDQKVWLADDILVKVDRATMAHSLESRAPFLDHRLVEFAASLPIGWKLNGLKRKYLLKRALGDRLPQKTLDQKKRGFNAPVSHWLLGPLREVFFDTLHSKGVKDLLDQDGVEKLYRQHKDNKADHGMRLFNLLCLGVWLNERSVAAVPGQTKERISV